MDRKKFYFYVWGLLHFYFCDLPMGLNFLWQGEKTAKRSMNKIFEVMSKQERHLHLCSDCAWGVIWSGPAPISIKASQHFFILLSEGNNRDVSVQLPCNILNIAIKCSNWQTERRELILLIPPLQQSSKLVTQIPFLFVCPQVISNKTGHSFTPAYSRKQ